jgi:hypothetical protein
MVQEVTTQSFISRIVGSFFCILIGFGLIVGSFALIFWNESQGLNQTLSIKEIQKKLVVVANATYNPKNNYKPVYINGLAVTNSILSDQIIGISVIAIKLDRFVKTYQWQESVQTRKEKRLGGSQEVIKNYTYKPVWSDKLIQSFQFKDSANHQNPTVLPMASQHLQASKVNVGDYFLSPDLISKINGQTIINPATIDVAKLAKALGKQVEVSGPASLYVGQNPDSPQIGDMSISLSVVRPQVVSIIAQQVDNRLQPYQTSRGQTISLLALGKVSPENMIHQALAQNVKMIWIVRLSTLFMMIAGFVFIMRPVVVLADVVPFFGTIAGLGSGLIAIFLGLISWLIATSIAWFAVHPLVALAMIIIIIVAVGYVFFSPVRR